MTTDDQTHDFDLASDLATGKKKAGPIRIAAIQNACTADVAANVEMAVQSIRQAAEAGAQVICLQEMFTSLYFCQSETHAHFALAESIPGPTTEYLCEVAAQLGVVVVAGLFERRAPGLYHNTAVVIDADGTVVGIYRKMHIPDDPFYYEKFYFTPGDTGFKAWDTKYGRIGVLICWDQWYPEGARLTAMDGAEILFYPTAIGWHPKEKAEYGTNQHGAWEIIQRSHAVANGCYVAAINRIGLEQPIGGDGLEFWGQSFVAGTSGQIIAKASVDKEEILIVPIELDKVDTTRTHWPFLRDRRIDAYGDLTKRFRK